MRASEKISCDHIYKRFGFITGDGIPKELHQVCKHHDSCWEGAENRFPPKGDEWSNIARPWTGNRYSELRLLVLGINLNGYGGLDALTELTEEAREGIATGLRKIRFHSDYSDYQGSLLWHRLGCYAATIAEYKGITSLDWGDDGYPSAQDVSQAYNFIAFTEHIKCSPAGYNSAPTVSMWENCGTHVLREEIRVLKPSYLLILGKSNNAYYVDENVLDAGFQKKEQFGQIQLASGKIEGEYVLIFIVPHPSAYGGAAGSIIDDIKRAVDWLPSKLEER